MKIQSKAMLKKTIWSICVKCCNQLSLERDKLQDFDLSHEEYVIQNCALIELDIQNYYYYKALLSGFGTGDSIHVTTGKRHLLNSMELEFKNRRDLFLGSMNTTSISPFSIRSYSEVFAESFSDYYKGSTPLDYCNIVYKRISA